jgi:CRP-like cAMP-binding protein
LPQRFDLTELKTQALAEIGRMMEAYPDITPLLFQDGEYIIREGERAQDVFVVLTGAFVVEQSSMLLDRPSAPLVRVACEVENFAIVGEMAYLGAQTRTASIRAVAPTHCLCLKPSHVDAIIEGYPMLTRVICQQFAQRLKEANDALRELQALRDLS